MVGVHEKHLAVAHMKELLDYDASTGTFTWLPRKNAYRGWNKKFAGKPAGHITNHGYLRIVIYERKYFGHRLAWAWMSGEWPDHEVDHRNLVRNDNRYKNLRVATHQQNNCNTYLQTNNTSGQKGVTWDKQRLKWRAQIKCHGVMKNLGRFDRFDDAVAAYEAAAVLRFGLFKRQSELRPMNGVS